MGLKSDSFYKAVTRIMYHLRVIENRDMMQDIQLHHLEGFGEKQTPYQCVVDAIRRDSRARRPRASLCLRENDAAASTWPVFLESAFTCLEDYERILIVMYAVDGFTFAEIAGFLGYQESTIGLHYWQAIEKLKKSMK